MPVDGDSARTVVRLSRSRNGAISTEQLHTSGLTRHAILARVKRGSLVRQFQGV
jgi:hypothetical protein